MRIINAIVKEYVPASPDTGLPELLLATADGDRTFGGWDIPEDEFKFGLLDALHPDDQAGLRMFGPGDFCRLKEEEEEFGNLVEIGHADRDIWYRPEPVDPPTAEERLALIGRMMEWAFDDTADSHFRSELSEEKKNPQYFSEGLCYIACAIACPAEAFEPGVVPYKYNELIACLKGNPNGLLDELVRFKAIRL
jgi:hypothetical protein